MILSKKNKTLAVTVGALFGVAVLVFAIIRATKNSAVKFTDAAVGELKELFTTE